MSWWIRIGAATCFLFVICSCGTRKASQGLGGTPRNDVGDPYSGLYDVRAWCTRLAEDASSVSELIIRSPRNEKRIEGLLGNAEKTETISNLEVEKSNASELIFKLPSGEFEMVIDLSSNPSPYKYSGDLTVTDPSTGTPKTISFKCRVID